MRLFENREKGKRAEDSTRVAHYIFAFLFFAYLLFFDTVIFNLKLHYAALIPLNVELQYHVSELCTIARIHCKRMGGFPLAPRRLVKYWRLLIRKPTKLRGNRGEEASGEEESDAESPRCVKTLKCNKSRRIASSSKHTNKRVWKPSEKCYSVNQPANYIRLSAFPLRGLHNCNIQFIEFTKFMKTKCVKLCGTFIYYKRMYIAWITDMFSSESIILKNKF